MTGGKQMKGTIQKLILVFSACLVMTAFAGVVVAAPVPSALAITGQVSFDAGYAATAIGGAAQSGDFSTRQGGILTSSSFSGATVTGANPLPGTLTDIGDGFGITAHAATSALSTFAIGNDINFLNVQNNSATDSYKVTFKIDFTNNVDSSGNNSYAHSLYHILDSSFNEVFFTEIWSDTLNGNRLNGPYTGDYGGPVTDSGSSFFDITLSPGQLAVFNAAFTMENTSGVYELTGTASADFTSFLSVDGVSDLTNPVPEPATILYVSMGLLGMIAIRRRSR
jgi:hypothetical protein